MKKVFSTLLLISFYCILFATTTKNSSIDYIKNDGQWENPVLYKADLKGGWVFLEKNALTYKFLESKEVHNHKENDASHQQDVVKGHVYKIHWLNANENAIVSANEKLTYYNNYYLGKDETKWKSNVSVFRAVHYQNIYPNIDFKFYSEATSMKSDYIVRKNGNVNNIQLKYDGVDQITTTEDGKLKITTSINTVYELKPYAYQTINGIEVEVTCNYQLNNNVLSFELPNSYNKNYDLIIDPTLVFSSYSGSFSDNWGSSATHDNNGNMFLGGIALGGSYPTTTGAFQTTFGGGSGGEATDIAITKFNSTGTAKLYSTYLGGSSNEILASLNCTANNELVSVVVTSSTNFPTTTNAYDRTFNGGTSSSAIGGSISFPNGSDIAITKFNVAGSALIGSTFFGGSGNDGLNLNTTTNYNYGDDSRSDIAIDANGNIYVVSTTTSTNIPATAGKAQSTNGGGTYDGMLAKFNSSLSTLNWATYYGGSGVDAAFSIALDNNNNIFICGGTASNNLPGRSNGLNTSFRGGTTDGFIAKFDNNANSVLSATYLGTDSYDQAFIIDVDATNNVYVFGQTNGNYPVSSGVYSNAGANQFIHKLNNTLNTTSFSTVFGSTNSSTINITPTAFLVDVCNNIYAVGWGGRVNNVGNTFNMPLSNDAYQSTTDGSDFYLINLSANATNLVYATYYGENGGVGDHVDGGTSRFDKNGIVYQAVCASCGGSNSFPVTAGVVGPNNNASNCNMAGFKFNFNLTGMQIISAAANPPTGCTPFTTSFTYTSTQPGTSWYWDFGDGTSSTSEFPSHTYNTAGNYTIRFILSNPQNCNPIDSTTFTITVTGEIRTTILNQSVCQGESVTIGTQTFNSTGTYTVRFTAANGCDSVVTLNLIVNSKKATTLNRNICQGQSVTVGTQTFNTSGTYVVTLQTSTQCDSVITLNLTINPNKDTTINKTICEGESVSIGQQTFSTNGIHTVNLQSTKGCDSIVTLNLTVNPKKTTRISDRICEGESVTVGNQTFSASGNYVVHLLTSAGCDSAINLSLIVNPTYDSTINKVLCTGISVTIGNQVFSETGNYVIPFSTASGCDSIIRLNLLVTDTIVENISQQICKGRSTTVAGQTFSEAGTYQIFLTATDRCDSLINLTIITIDTSRENITETICDGDSVIVATQVFKTEGNYTLHLPAANGCDSLINLRLNVIPIQRTEVNRTICEGESVTIGNQTFRDSGTYTIHLSSAQNCDSIVTLNLLVNPLPVINATADKTSALNTDPIQLDVVTTETLTYNWTPVGNVDNPLIQNPIGHITQTTWFVVTATNPQTSCKTTDSVIVEIDYLPCTNKYIFIPNAFSPNGDGKNDVFLVRSTILKSMHIEIFDRWGIKMFESNDQLIGWDGKYKGQLAPDEAYGYYFKGECIQGEEITLKGNLTILK